MKIPDETKIQCVDLRVKNLEASLNFYSELIGLKLIETINNTAFLSANGGYPYLISLTGNPDALPRHKGATGLFHTAIRLPNRKELARVFLRLFNNKIKFQGFSDHLVSEAIYLADPDENGVELYADRPRELWKYKMGQIEMNTLPLNLSVLTDELDDRNVWNGIHPGTDIGHIHLNVSSLHKAQEVYSMAIGFNISNSTYPGALFFAAGGYHHHIGVNTWSSKNGSPSPDNSAGLTGFTVKIPGKEFPDAVLKNINELGYKVLNTANSTFSFLDFDKNKITLTL